MTPTDRLYYTDPLLREFTARVLERRDVDGRPAVLLDRTAFYPTSGGQPHDTGALGGERVLDVWDDDAGLVWHRVEHHPADDQIHGTIDWNRRFDHMQQHTGQHLLSAAFVDLRHAPTASFHLGTGDSSIDLEIRELTWDDAFAVEAHVNRIIWDNLAVDVRFFTETELRDVPLRKAPKVTGRIRVVWIQDVDASACGGTHVPRTGGVGLLKIVRLERYKGGMRVGFVCGGRALSHFQRALRGLQTVGADLSVHPDQVPETVVRLQGDLKTARKDFEAARGILLVAEAERVWAETPVVDGVRRVLLYRPDWGPDHLMAIGGQLASRPRTVALLAGHDAKGLRLFCRRSDDLDLDASAVLRRALELLGGKGGGTRHQAQGGAPPADPATIERAMRQAVP